MEVERTKVFRKTEERMSSAWKEKEKKINERV